MEPNKPDYEEPAKRTEDLRGGSLDHAGKKPDVVDEQMDESFPASDPPSWSGSTADRSRQPRDERK